MKKSLREFGVWHMVDAKQYYVITGRYYIMIFNTLRSRQHGPHFADDTFKRIFVNENLWISIKISLKFVPKSPIDKIPALFQTMAWRRPGDKPLSEAMMVSLLRHICVARPQWVNNFMKQGRVPRGTKIAVTAIYIKNKTRWIISF